MKRTMSFLALFNAALCAASLVCLSACGGKTENQATKKPELSRSQVKEWEASAEKGDALAKYNLAKMYRDGEGMPQNFTNAAVWFRKSAEEGYAKAEYQLALAYTDGLGVAKDVTEAAKWMEKASNQGYGNAQEKLGFVYWKGEGVATNLVAAHKWLALAAANGEGKAAKGLKKIELSMSQQQIAEARKLKEAFIPKKVFKKGEDK